MRGDVRRSGWLPLGAVGCAAVGAVVAIGLVGRFGIDYRWAVPPASAGRFAEWTGWSSGGRLGYFWSPAASLPSVRVAGRTTSVAPQIGVGFKGQFNPLAVFDHHAIDGFDAHWLGPPGVGL